ncbi:MAG: type II secretion system GspH family protein [Candidatus Babeliaceae bacterium]|nr:type II secretion system GspH family protein [Candidatus Babeliaceae bacterium]
MDKSVNGFSLLEIIVAMAIVAIMATQVPRLTRINYNQQEKFIAELNVLARNAYTLALVSGRPTQLFFDFESQIKKVTIRKESDKKNVENKAIFEIVQSEYGNNSLLWNDNFEIEKFIIDGKDEAIGASLKTVWFYIMPDGLSQQVTLVLRDESVGKSFELGLNPFFVQFVMV